MPLRLRKANKSLRGQLSSQTDPKLPKGTVIFYVSLGKPQPWTQRQGLNGYRRNLASSNYAGELFDDLTGGDVLWLHTQREGRSTGECVSAGQCCPLEAQTAPGVYSPAKSE